MKEIIQVAITQWENCLETCEALGVSKDEYLILFGRLTTIESIARAAGFKEFIPKFAQMWENVLKHI